MQAASVKSGSPVTLRVLGTSVTLLEKIRQQAADDLGINLVFLRHDVQEAQRIAVMHPDRYDLYDQWFHNVDFVWPARAIQPIDISRIDLWDSINSLPKTGSLVPGRPPGLGSVPVKRLYLQHDYSLDSNPTEKISMLPLTHNADSFAYHSERLPDALCNTPESWSWLLHPDCSGRVALQNDAAIGALDAALAVQSQGLAHFADISNLSLSEIDQLADILQKKSQLGHFAGFWEDQQEALAFLRSPRICLQSLWSPTFFQQHDLDQGYRLAHPREGYRAWYGGLSISKQASGRTLDAAYAYLNWWLSGWPGAMMARQGYYISNPQNSRPFLSPAEWDYWYAGLPASQDLPDIDGNRVVRQGERRDGGSYEQRMSHIAVWNSVMDEHNYLVRRWQEVLNALKPNSLLTSRKASGMRNLRRYRCND